MTLQSASKHRPFCSKGFVVIVVCWAGILVCGCSARGKSTPDMLPSQAANYYIFQEKSYALKLPLSWQHKANKDKSAIMFCSPEQKSEATAIFIQEWSNPKSQPIHMLQAALDKQARSLAIGAKATSQEICVGDHLYQGVVLLGKMGGKTVTVRHVAVPGINWVLDVSIVQPNETHDKEVDVILKNIKIAANINSHL